MRIAGSMIVIILVVLSTPSSKKQLPVSTLATVSFTPLGYAVDFQG